MRRYELIKSIAPLLDNDTFVIANLGFPSQELYSVHDSPNNFYMLGSMGLASSIGLGVSMEIDNTVIAIDGDGSVLMNLGTLSTIALEDCKNYILFIVDNGSYGSTGDQPTHTAKGTSLAAIAKAAGIASSVEVQGVDAADKLAECMKTPGPHVIVAKVEPGSQGMNPIPMTSLAIRDRFREAIKEAKARA